MNVGDLLIGIRIKGAGKAKEDLFGVKAGLNDVKDSSFAAKAAIVGAVYALEHFMHSSMMAGTGLVNFNNLTGVSVKNLQGWEYGFQKAGASAEEAGQTILGIQRAMGQMALNKGMPEGMVTMSNLLMQNGKGGVDYQRAKTDMLYLMERARDFAKLTAGNKNLPAMNEILHGVGFSDSFISASRRGMLDKDVMAKAPAYSDKEAGSLDKIRQQWFGFFRELEMAVGRFNVAHGGELIKGITEISHSLVELADVIMKLAESLHAFQGVSHVMHFMSTVIGSMAGDKKSKKEASGIADKASDFLGTIATGDLGEKPLSERILDTFMTRPNTGAAAGAGLGGAAGTVQQTNNFYGVKDAEEAVLHLERASGKAMKQTQTSQVR